jgi:hypothetical protein
MPDMHFGFRRDRSMLQAVHNLLNYVKEALKLPGGKLFTVFVDFSKAFDMPNTAKLLARHWTRPCNNQNTEGHTSLQLCPNRRQHRHLKRHNTDQ